MKFASTWNAMFHLLTCDKITTALCVQAAGACQSTQCKNFISGSVRHILWGVERYFLAFGNKCNSIFDFYDVNQVISEFFYIP